MSVDYKKKYENLRALVNRPHIKHFLLSATLEAAHQRDRWGEEHDQSKNPEMWFWSIKHLASKALVAYKAGDLGKAKHHTISSPALLAHWHEHLSRNIAHHGN